MKRMEEVVGAPAEGDGPRLARPQWQRGVVLLCSKCSGEQHDAAGPDTMPSMGTWELRCWLKERMTAEGLWPSVRVLTSSCMGICNDGYLTIAFGGELAGAGDSRCLVVDPARDREEILAMIREAAPGV